jgi:hypothetical protein
VQGPGGGGVGANLDKRDVPKGIDCMEIDFVSLPGPKMANLAAAPSEFLR